MTFLEKLYILLDNKRMTRNKLVTELDLSKNAVQNWEKTGQQAKSGNDEKDCRLF